MPFIIKIFLVHFRFTCLKYCYGWKRYGYFLTVFENLFRGVYIRSYSSPDIQHPILYPYLNTQIVHLWHWYLIISYPAWFTLSVFEFESGQKYENKCKISVRIQSVFVPKYCPIVLQMDVKAAKKAVIEGIQCIKVNYYLLLACLGTTSLSLYCKREYSTSRFAMLRILLFKWVQFFVWFTLSLFFDTSRFHSLLFT